MVEQSQRSLTEIERIPPRLLSGLPRCSLTALALQGEGISVFHELGDEPDELTLGLQSLTWVRSDHDVRVRVSEYAAAWRAYYRILTGRSGEREEANRALVATRRKGNQ
jgi:hypothetical protein